jgi:hypothetical protein
MNDDDPFLSLLQKYNYDTSADAVVVTNEVRAMVERNVDEKLREAVRLALVYADNHGIATLNAECVERGVYPQIKKQ